jgi:hypothetical protein
LAGKCQAAVDANLIRDLRADKRIPSISAATGRQLTSKCLPSLVYIPKCAPSEQVFPTSDHSALDRGADEQVVLVLQIVSFTTASGFNGSGALEYVRLIPSSHRHAPRPEVPTVSSHLLSQHNSKMLVCERKKCGPISDVTAQHLPLRMFTWQARPSPARLFHSGNSNLAHFDLEGQCLDTGGVSLWHFQAFL